MGMSFFDALKVLKGTEVEAPRIIPLNHTPNHTPESYPRIIPHEFFFWKHTRLSKFKYLPRQTIPKEPHKYIIAALITPAPPAPSLLLLIPPSLLLTLASPHPPLPRSS